MKVWSVWVDGNCDFASEKYFEAKSRANYLANLYGKERVTITMEVVE